MHPVRTLLVASAAAVCGLAAASTPAAAEATVDASGVIRYDQDEVLANPVRYVKQGERTSDGGCRFEWSGVVPRSDRPIVDHELAFDPSTCQSVRARGELISRGRDGTTAADTDKAGTSADGTAPASTYGRWTAYIHSWWEDPPQKDVTKVENEIEWAPDATCAAPTGSNPIRRVRRYWLSDTGWSPVSHVWDEWATCSEVRSGSDARFVNDDFCDTVSGPFIDPEDDRTRHVQSIRGEARARSHFGISSEKSGGCSFLLTFDWESRTSLM